jgi:hypothetical protein
MSTKTQNIWTGNFWKAATERAIKTVAQVELVFLGADVVNVLSVDWTTAAGIGGGALVVSYLSSIASSAVTGDGPSLTNNEVLASKVDHLTAA